MKRSKDPQRSHGARTAEEQIHFCSYQQLKGPGLRWYNFEEEKKHRRAKCKLELLENLKNSEVEWDKQ